ncbi:hypothetical protein [Anaerosporobacter faecicola]|uniref:hypothetical protein n=1 Tax=Anaerosporobacter faecicola TaxID=2718714 RepID=UPI001438B3FD|nr:hypothetical protein [Anaerosporobacter faecicola]
MKQSTNKQNTSKQGIMKGKQIDWDRYITDGKKKKSTSNKNENNKNASSKSANGKTVNKSTNSKNTNGKSTNNKNTNSFIKKTNVQKNTAEKKGKIIGKLKKPVEMNLFYMATKELDCKQILAPIQEEKGMEIQVWPELGISSIEFGEGKSIDFQECEYESFDSESDREFLEEMDVKVIYEVMMLEECKSQAVDWFLSMIQENGGFFCTDSDDFTPIYHKEELERWR